MAETFEQYQSRIFSYVEGKDPLRILRATPAALARRISGVSRRTLMTPPAKGKWSVAQILAHLSELEMLWGYRVRMILERDGVELVGMDQNVWARNSRYDRIDPRRALDTFRAIRQANVDLFERLSQRALKRRGVHSQFGTLTISSIMSLTAGHDINHSRQIDAILGKSRTRAGQARGHRRRGRGRLPR